MLNPATVDDLLHDLSAISDKVRATGQPKTVDSLALLNEAIRVGETVVLAPGEYSGAVELKGDIPVVARLTGATITSPDQTPALKTIGQAGQKTLIDGKFTCLNGADTVVNIGYGTETTVRDIPHNITLINTTVLGAAAGQKRGISIHAAYVTLINPTVGDIRMHDQDTQAVWFNNGPGPYTVSGGFLSAAGENLLMGGDDPRIAGCTPADVLLDGVVFHKPTEWKALQDEWTALTVLYGALDPRTIEAKAKVWQVKNLLELKNARRVSITNSVFDGCWAHAQAGYAVLFTVRNQYGRATWSTVEDITFTHNVVKNCSSFLSMHGDDDLQPSQRSVKFLVADNDITVNKAVWGGDGRVAQVGRAPQGIRWERNISRSNGSAPFYAYTGGLVSQSVGCTFIDNAFLHNAYGFNGVGTTGEPLLTLAKYYPGMVWTGNTVGGGLVKQYPTGTIILPPADWVAKYGPVV